MEVRSIGLVLKSLAQRNAIIITEVIRVRLHVLSILVDRRVLTTRLLQSLFVCRSPALSDV